MSHNCHRLHNDTLIYCTFKQRSTQNVKGGFRHEVAKRRSKSWKEKSQWHLLYKQLTQNKCMLNATVKTRPNEIKGDKRWTFIEGWGTQYRQQQTRQFKHAVIVIVLVQLFRALKLCARDGKSCCVLYFLEGCFKTSKFFLAESPPLSLISLSSPQHFSMCSVSNPLKVLFFYTNIVPFKNFSSKRDHI